MVLLTPPSYCWVTNELSHWLHALDVNFISITRLGWLDIYIPAGCHPALTDSNILLNFAVKDWQSLVGSQPRRFYNWGEREGAVRVTLHGRYSGLVEIHKQIEMSSQPAGPQNCSDLLLSCLSQFYCCWNGKRDVVSLSLTGWQCSQVICWEIFLHLHFLSAPTAGCLHNTEKYSHQSGLRLSSREIWWERGYSGLLVGQQVK